MKVPALRLALARLALAGVGWRTLRLLVQTLPALIE